MKKYLIPFVMSIFGLAIFAGCDLSGTQDQIEDPAEELSYKLSTNEASLRVVEYAVEDSDCITHFSKFTRLFLQKLLIFEKHCDIMHVGVCCDEQNTRLRTVLCLLCTNVRY